MKISVKKAILVGQLVVNLPTIIILFVVMITPMFFIKGNTPLILIGLPVSFVIAWLYGSFATNKWKLWAYKNCEDRVGLKKAAIKGDLDLPDDSIFNKYIFKSNEVIKLENKLSDKIDSKKLKIKTPALLTLKGIIVFALTLIIINIGILLIKVF